MARTFSHPPAVRSFWRALVRQALRQGVPTPFYLFSTEPLRAAQRELDRAFAGLPVRHWLSCKTQPLRPLLEWWQGQGRPVEVVSEFEFRAARHAGFSPERILVNGPAKHRWLPGVAVAGLGVNFDSVHELRALAPLARQLGWRVGLRLRTTEEYDPESPEFPTQFGLGPADLPAALQLLRRQGLTLETLHFHLRTNVAGAGPYRRALAEVRALCTRHRLEPRHLDCGGGFPPPHVQGYGGRFVDERFNLASLAQLHAEALRAFPSVTELWLENGRWFSARSGVLVVRVLDAKDARTRPPGRSRAVRNLLCDGGRTLNALVSNWEAHELLPLPPRSGPAVLTTVNGPTCMAFDKLARRPLPAAVRPGDHLLWLEAGAYHLPWETRFSHGLGAVLWHDGQKITQVRAAESFEDWWLGPDRRENRPAKPAPAA